MQYLLSILPEAMTTEIIVFKIFHLSWLAVIEIVANFVLLQILLYTIEHFVAWKNRAELQSERRAKALRKSLEVIAYIVFTVVCLLILKLDLGSFSTSIAALFVGLGLALQNVFEDWISGIILNLDGSLNEGDHILFEGELYIAYKMHSRTVQLDSPSLKSIVVPNSKLLKEPFTNLDLNESPTFFNITTSVAYNADIDLVTKLLIDVVKDTDLILSDPEPIVRLDSLNEYSLDFMISFAPAEYRKIFAIKESLRRGIMISFRKNNIEIPYPTHVEIRQS